MDLSAGRRTINPIQSKLIDQLPRGADKELRFRPAPRDMSEIVAALAAAADGQDHAQLGVLLFQLGKGAETAGCPVDGYLVIGPFITQL